MDKKYLGPAPTCVVAARMSVMLASLARMSDRPQLDDDDDKVDVRRSRRRTRTVSAYREGETIVVLIPAKMTRLEEQEWVTTMIAKVRRAERRRRPGDAALSARAEVLSHRYLDGLATPASVRWVTNQRARWGSCTPLDKSIRLSSRLQGVPSYVVDYVLLHELSHLLVAGHGDDFWQWVNRFDLAERARGFLEGVSAATRSAGVDETGADTAGTTDVEHSGDVDECER